MASWGWAVKLGKWVGKAVVWVVRNPQALDAVQDVLTKRRRQPPGAPEPDRACNAESSEGAWRCTLPDGHPGLHAAVTDAGVQHAWPRVG